MSLLSQQNILGGTQSAFAEYSFGPETSKRSTEFIYNSPTRSYAPDKAAAEVVGNTAGEFPIGIDGTPVIKGASTKYGGDVDGVLPRLSSGDSSLLTGIAKVISGRPAQNEYKAIDYFQGRTPRATKSYHQTGAGANVQGANGGGSGAQRAFYHFADQYPDEILTGADSEWVPSRPETGGTGLANLIPLTPGGGDGSVGNQSSNELDEPPEDADDEIIEKDSVVEVNISLADLDQSLEEELNKSDGYVNSQAGRSDGQGPVGYSNPQEARGYSNPQEARR